MFLARSGTRARAAGRGTAAATATAAAGAWGLLHLGEGWHGWVGGTRREYVLVGSHAPSMAHDGPANPPVPPLGQSAGAQRKSAADQWIADVQDVAASARLAGHAISQKAWVGFIRNVARAGSAAGPLAAVRLVACQAVPGRQCAFTHGGRNAPSIGRTPFDPLDRVRVRNEEPRYSHVSGRPAHRSVALALLGPTSATSQLSRAGVCGFAGPSCAMDGAREPTGTYLRRVPRTRTPPPKPAADGTCCRRIS